MSAPTLPTDPSSRLLALQQFDDSKTGVKGLADSGITSLPALFVHPSPTAPPANPAIKIPTVDLSLPRSTLVPLISSVARSFGFFHVTNHLIPLPLLSRSISAVRSFNNLPLEIRSQHYSRQFRGGVCYNSNFDLFRSAAASWRDTIQIHLAPARPDPAQIPEACRSELLDLDGEVTRVGSEIMGLLAEGLGVEKGRLEELSCCDGRMMVCHCYPWCPEPEKTAGITQHTDTGILTVLAQDWIGGLQVKCEEGWADVEPVEGALIINIGDLLQVSVC